ncbi:CDP-diacylglycerol--glycerol-3-phosphate 3-phosphatidyltransferase [Pseudolysinimonas sp.]|uniref:CDP-diacylglycerol--glycerol-3-phosphate 3-phosphatidyltransferase n=1 Tax=Pseudolysinimonas sp. TaxID=2680009 RepID=UPI003F7CF64A
MSAARPNPMRGRVTARGETPASWGNIANIITVVRILLAPVFIWLLLEDGGRDGWVRWLAAALFVVAILTDSVDGFLARGRNLVTDAGKILDPIADKVLVGGALVALSILGEVWWWVTIVILVREVGITVYRFVVIRSRVVPADLLGKIKTWVQSIAVTLALLPLDRVVGPWYSWVVWVLLGAALVLTLVSGASYLVAASRAGRAAKA